MFLFRHAMSLGTSTALALHLFVVGCALEQRAPSLAHLETPSPVAEPVEIDTTLRMETQAALYAAIEQYQQILMLTRDRDEYETSKEYAARRLDFDGRRAELAALESRTFLLSLDVEAGRYDADRGLYPVRVSKTGLLASAYGEVNVDRTEARRIKADLTTARAAAQIRSGHAHIQDVWIRTRDGQVPVWIPNAWTEGPTYTGITRSVRSLDFSPDGTRLVAADTGGPIHLWDLERFTHTAYEIPVEPPRTRQDSPTEVLFAPDGETVVIATHDARLEYWDPATDELMHLPLGHSNQVTSLRMSADGQSMLTSSYDKTARIWRYSDRQPLLSLPAYGGITSDAAYLPSGDVVTAQEDGSIAVWDVHTGTRKGTLYEQDAQIYCFAASQTVPLLAFGATPLGDILVIDTETGKLVREWRSLGAHVWEMRFASDGRTLIAAPETGAVHIYDVITGETLQITPKHRSLIFALALSPNEALLASGSQGSQAHSGDVKLWYRVGAEIPSIVADIPIEPLSPTDKTYIASATTSGTISASKPQPGTPATAVVTPPDAATAVTTQPPELDTHAPAADTLVRTRALLVGVDEYDHHANLVNPVNDVQTIQEELRDVYGTGTQTLANPTRREFQQALHALADQDYGDQDQLLVMFSGHGYFDERIKRGYLAFRDSLPLDEDPYFESYVSHGEVREILERLDCEHVLLIVDSCFAGTLDPLIAMAPGARPVDGGVGLIPTKQYIKRKLRFKTRRYITAGGKEYVPDGRPGQHSPFVRQLLAGLRSYGGNDGILTLEELTLYLERVDPQPRTGELFGNEPGSSFVLVANLLDEEEPAAKFASLVVAVSPPDATVNLVGGPPAAESLLKTLRVEPTGTAERRYHLPLGTYRLRIGREGYASVERDVTLSADGLRTEVTLHRR